MSTPQKLIAPDNLSKICRVCLKEKPLILKLKLSSKIHIEGEECPPSSIANLFDQMFPHQKMIRIRGSVICLDCFNEFKVVLFFYKKCKQSCVLFQRFFDGIQKDPLEDTIDQTSIIIGSNEETSTNFSIDETFDGNQKDPLEDINDQTSIIGSNEETIKDFTIEETFDGFQKDPLEDINDQTSNIIGSNEESSSNFSIEEINLPSANIKENKPPINSIDLKRKPQKAVVKIEKPDVPVEKKDFRHSQTCPICFKEFEMELFRKHIHKHKSLKPYLSIPRSFKVSPNAKFICSRSENASVTQVALNARPIKLHKCPHCNLELSAAAFPTHIEMHKKKDIFACDKCDRVFHGINHLLNHKIFCQSTERPYKCKICAKGFVIKKNYDCHLLLHTATELPYQCQICLVRFSNPIHFRRHKHPENETSFRKTMRCKKMSSRIVNLNGRDCDICSKVFFKPESYYKHMSEVHNTESTSLCSICGVSVKRINYYHHMKVHKGKPYQCEECGKTFVTSTHLRRHLMMHSGLKPFICCSCGKSFNNISSLKMHEVIHTGVKNHKCTVCGKGFFTKIALTKHLKTHQSIS